MQINTKNKHNDYFLFPSQHQLLGAMKAFVHQRDEALKSNTITVEDIRNGEQQFLDMVVKEHTDVNCIDDYYIPTSYGNQEKILLRIYDPVPKRKNNDGKRDSLKNGKDLTPCLIYIHGGGGVQLSVQFYDYVLRYIANSSGLKVAAMNYRLAPENPFPAGLDDVVDSIKWIVKNGEKLGIDKHRLALGGDSAGATMSLAAALRLREEGIDNQHPFDRDTTHLLRALFLVYGHYSPNVMKSESMQIFGEKEWSFTTKTYLGWYLQNLHQNKEDYSNQHAFPLLTNNLNNIPPAYIVTTPTDTYRDDNIALARRFEQEKKEYYLVTWPGVMHASINLLHVTPEVQKYIDSMTAFLGGILGA